MAVVISGTTGQYTSTSGIPGSAWTITAWVRIGSASAMGAAVGVHQSDSVAAHIFLRDTGDLQLIDYNTYAFNGVNPLAVSANTWYRVAAVATSATNVTFYRAAATGALGSGSVTDFAGPTAPTTVYVGDHFYDEAWGGRIAAVKLWGAALTQAEVEAELAQYVPRRVANLLHFHPFVRAETTDYSGGNNSLTGGSGATTADGPPIPWRRISPRLILPAPSGAAPITLGQAVETNTATAFTRSKTLNLGQSTETGTATALGRSKSTILGQATESGTAPALTRSKALTAGQATEADTVSALTRTKSRVIGQVVETDTAHGLARAKQLAVGPAQETDTSQSLAIQGSNVVALGQAVETNTASPLTRSKSLSIAQATDTETALAFTVGSAVVLGQAVETSTALSMTRAKLLILVGATETDSAFTLTRPDTLPGQHYIVGTLTTAWSVGLVSSTWTVGNLEE